MGETRSAAVNHFHVLLMKQIYDTNLCPTKVRHAQMKQYCFTVALFEYLGYPQICYNLQM